ncbi:MAG: hypothetical protein R3C02_18735 [Planctomycetaceae bacterium]
MAGTVVELNANGIGNDVLVGVITQFDDQGCLLSGEADNHQFIQVAPSAGEIGWRLPPD